MGLMLVNVPWLSTVFWNVIYFDRLIYIFNYPHFTCFACFKWVLSHFDTEYIYFLNENVIIRCEKVFELMRKLHHITCKYM